MSKQTLNEIKLRNLLQEKQYAIASHNNDRLEYLEREIAVVKSNIEKEKENGQD